MNSKKNKKKCGFEIELNVEYQNSIIGIHFNYKNKEIYIKKKATAPELKC
jgi:hypothetical protein